MATARIFWSAHDGQGLDGSSGNAAPALLTIVGTEANPKKPLAVAAFDPATDEHLAFIGVMPAEYLSGGAVNIYWMANATTSTTCRWGARIGAVTPSDADTPLEHAAAAASTAAGSNITAEARRLNKTTITLANLDSLAGGDLFWLIVYRDADGTSGTDDLAVDAELIAVELSYTV